MLVLQCLCNSDDQLEQLHKKAGVRERTDRVQLHYSRAHSIQSPDHSLASVHSSLPLAGSLSGRVAIVTGSTSGIGLGIARSFLAAGANVMLNGFGDAKEVEATRAGLE